MKNNYKLKSLFVLCSLLFMGLMNSAFAQCTNASAFGSATAPGTVGASVNFSTCSYGGEYSPLNGTTSGYQYQISSSIATDYITVHQGTVGGPVVAMGTTPITFTSIGGTYYCHWNTNAACGAASVCRTTTVTLLSIPCSGTPTAGTITGSASVCSGTGTTLGLSGTSSASGITYQWASSTTSGGPYTNMGTASTQATGSIVATTYYVNTITCTNSGLSAVTPEFTVSPGVVAALNPVHPACAGGATGSFTQGTVTCGTAPFNYSVNGGPFGPIPTNLVAGTYSVVIQDVTMAVSSPISVVLNPGITVPAPTGTNATVCQNAASAMISASSAIAQTQVVGFNVSTQPTETNAAPGVTMATGTMLALPAGAVVTGGTLTYNNITALGASWRSDVRLGFSGAVLNAAAAGSALNSAGIFNYTRAIPAAAINVAGGTVNLLYWDFVSDNTGVEATFATGSPAATLTINYTIPSTIAWYDASTGGTLLGTGASMEAVGTSVLPTTATPGTYNFYAEAGYTSCVSTRTLVTVTVNPLPIVTASPAPMTVCQNDMITLSGGGASTYAWSGGATNGVAFSASTTTTYTVTGTSGLGCMNTASTTITVNPAPVVTANSTATTVCMGDNITLTGGGAVSYAWSGGAMDATPFAPAATTTYTVTGTDAMTCTSTATIMVTVNTLPTVTAMAMPMSVCPGVSTTLMGMGATSYAWSGGVTDMMAFVPMMTTTYTVTGTDGNGCMNTATQMVTVYTPPTVTANTTATAVCMGDMITLTGGGASTYTWDNGVMDGTPIVAMDTTYVVVGTDGNGCMDTASVMITVNPLPIVTATSSNDSVCIGDSTMVMGMGASTYMWSGGVMDMMNFMPMASATYTVTGTDVNGCMNTATTMVVVNMNPVVMASASATTVCVGTMVTFTGSGASMYAWDMGVMNGVPAAVNATAMYTVVGTDMNGCMDTAMVTVTTNPLPTVMASVDNDTVCAGAMVTFMGSGAMTYMWDNGVTDGVAIMAMDTTYMVVGTDANGCMDTASVMVQVNMLPAVVANSSASAVCMGAPVTLMGGGAAMYTWTGGVSNGVAFTPSATVTYTVTGTDVNGCMNTASTTVTVNTLPTVTAMSDNDTICSGMPVTLMGGGAATYVWTSGVTNAVAFTPSASATYTVTGTDVNGCTGTATTMVTVNALPSVSMSAFSPDTVCFQTPGFTLTGGSPAGGVYSGTGVITGLFNPSSAGLGVFAVTYTTTGANGCTNSASANINVEDCTGIEENNSSAQINVFPNPTSGSFSLTISNASFTEMVISIMDVQGKEVFGSVENNIANGYNKEINLENLAKGIYYIKLTSDSDVRIQKLIIQ